MIHTKNLIIGASAAGLSVAKQLKDLKEEFIILEKSNQVATKWRNHYDRLHLHTSKEWSELPGKKFDKNLPKYPPKDSVVQYLEDYASENKIIPKFGVEVLKIFKKDNFWIIETNKEFFSTENLIIASGMNSVPKFPKFDGIETFPGKIIHSSEYKNGKEFAGKDVLIVGFGNSGCEQAICLVENGAFSNMSVRSGVNVLPRDVFGIPVLEVGKLTKFLPPKIADIINKPIIFFHIGNISKYGLKKHKYGPAEQVQKEKRIPLLDIGTLNLIKKGKIKIYENIKEINGKTVEFMDGRKQNFDAIIFATGYSNGLKKLMEISDQELSDLNNPIKKQRYFGKDNRYFCGFYLSPNGMLHEIAYESGIIAKSIVNNNRRK